MKCSIDGCDSRATWWVTSPTGITKMACTKCEEELLAVSRYKRVQKIGERRHGQRWEQGE